MPPPAKKAGVNAGQLHAHGCVVCSRRYTDSCKIPDVNSRCITCRSGKPRAKWDQDTDPRPCCREFSRPAGKEEIAKYALGGPGPWYICRSGPNNGCSRTHPYSPRNRT